MDKSYNRDSVLRTKNIEINSYLELQNKKLKRSLNSNFKIYIKLTLLKLKKLYSNYNLINY